MKKLIIAASILSVLGSPMAFAQGWSSQAPGKPPYVQPHGKSTRQGPPPHAQAKPHHSENRSQRAKGKPHYSEHRPEHRSQWSKGHRLPPGYRQNVVRDYRRHHLAPPPRGYKWVRVNNEYLMIGMVTGLISSIAQGR
ncbi:RcnB family protein [Ancylobacter pratisalsi]|uniref:Transmembrane signal peptide protein n=1 Tax=Ancylobacter pratisalsi TaxID=1745854 RepID=A0A6P1YNW8_9HYPH|nr:RcnB family protein [Ancylobacter pratisalsi]QIB34411.1 transmembrane signal peptide protein [Ancylobacter pratisalsi]